MFGGGQAMTCKRGENKCNGKKIRLLVAGCLRVVWPTAYERQQQQQVSKQI